MANLLAPEKSPRGQRINIASLLSPPEQTSESFGSSMAPGSVPTPASSFNSTTPQPKMGAMMKAWQDSKPREFPVYASPPISPYDTLFRRNSVESQVGNRSVDPQLFPEDPHSAAMSIIINQPLFPQEIKDSRSARLQSFQSDRQAHLKPQPAARELKEAVRFRSTVFEQALKNPRAWMLQERQWDNYYSQPAKSKKRLAKESLAPAPAAPTRLAKRPKRETVLSAASNRVLRSDSSAPLTPPLEAVQSFDEPTEEPLEKPKKIRKPKPTPKKAEIDTPKEDEEPTKEETKAGGDNQYWTVEDITVPVSAMPKDKNFLKPAYVANTPRDPSEDPAVELLHPSEFNLCFKMRIPADVYITTKRRIFLRRLEHLKMNKKFSKTHAQMCTHIDVTKASALWTTFNGAGWLDPELYEEHLKPKKPATGPTPNGLAPPRAVV